MPSTTPERSDGRDAGSGFASKRQCDFSAPGTGGTRYACILFGSCWRSSVVEHLHGKEGVRGSSPRASSIKRPLSSPRKDPWIVEPGSRVDLASIDPGATSPGPG